LVRLSSASPCRMSHRRSSGAFTVASRWTRQSSLELSVVRTTCHPPIVAARILKKSRPFGIPLTVTLGATEYGFATPGGVLPGVRRTVGHGVKECALNPWAQLCCLDRTSTLLTAGRRLSALMRRGASKESQHAVSKRRGRER